MSKPTPVGERLKLAPGKVSNEDFETQRRSYHSALQAAFFEHHHIGDVQPYEVQRGDSLWTLTQPKTDIPVWLLRQYNPDRDFRSLKPGDVLQMPTISLQSQ